jgi:hypothetical protein
MAAPRRPRREPDRGPAYWLNEQRKMIAERRDYPGGYVGFYARFGRDAAYANSLEAADTATLNRLSIAAQRGHL